MAGLMSAKTKRKDLDEGYDEFSEFYSPARKIRRLDAELPPIMEEEDAIAAVQQQMPPGLMSSPVPELGSAMVDAEPPFPLDEERALVLYKPVDNPFVLSPISPDVSFRVHSDLLNSLKNQAFWSANPNAVTVEEVPMDYKPAAANNSLAVVPWVPSRAPSAAACESRIMHVEEPMEAEEEIGSASMEVEEDIQQAGTAVAGEDLHQWPQHCLIPQPRESTSTPIHAVMGIGNLSSPSSLDKRQGSSSVLFF